MTVGVVVEMIAAVALVALLGARRRVSEKAFPRGADRENERYGKSHFVK
jgi:hypothetical protein